MNKLSNTNDLLDIDDVPGTADGDAECLLAVQQVLEKHGKATRFGVSLLHKHFDLVGDEVMMETQDVENRTLTSHPVSLSELAGQKIVTTMWRLDEQQIRVTGACAGGGYRGAGEGYYVTAESHYGYKDN
jgi:hypothetical protein